MHIQAAIHPTATVHEGSLIELQATAFAHQLDVDFTTLRRSLRRFDPIALDLLVIGACVYGIDKAVCRSIESADGWTCDLSVVIPVKHPDLWNTLSDELAECLGFLTGDNWLFRFELAGRDFIQPKKLKRRVRWRRIQATSISLFSGGMDSFIGCIDHLVDNPEATLALVGHYERHVAGPASDQDELADLLALHFPGRVTQLQCRIGLKKPGLEHSYRSRSFLFLALGVLAATSIGTDMPVVMPENGSIALNYPLTPSRHGSCSTRTAHPHFLRSIQGILQAAGLNHAIPNPYAFCTKGEMITACRDLPLLEASFQSSRSCAKFGHRAQWQIKTAHQCGVCVPCIFRRAALHKKGWDSETFGHDIAVDVPDAEYQENTYADLRALTVFIRRNNPPEVIRRELLCNGPIIPSEIQASVSLIERMRQEVRQWLLAKASKRIQEDAGLLVS